jgi:hypothetical protein
MTAATVTDRAADRLGDFLPQLAAALALLLVGLLLAALAGWLVRRALAAARLDELARRWRVDETLRTAGIRAPPSRLAGAAVRFVLSVVVVFAALAMLGLEPLTQSLNEAVLFLPQLIVALLLLLAGVVLAGLVRERVDRLAYQLDFPVPLGQLAQAATLVVFALLAAAQVGIATGLLLVVIAIVLGAAAATFALAFGLGGREMARALNAGRFVRRAYAVGQEIALGETSGRITALDPDAVVVQTAEGAVRIPNHLLLESVVRVGERPPPAAAPDAPPDAS